MTDSGMTAEERAELLANAAYIYFDSTDEEFRENFAKDSAEQIRQAEQAAYKRGLLEQLRREAHQDQANFKAARETALEEACGAVCDICWRDADKPSETVQWSEDYQEFVHGDPDVLYRACKANAIRALKDKPEDSR